MTITVSRVEFAKAVGDAARIVPARTALPFWSHLLLTQEKDRLTIHATDGNRQFQAWISGEPEDEQAAGSQATVPAGLMREILGAWDGTTVSLSSEGQKAHTLRLWRAIERAGEYVLPGVDPEQFPLVDEAEGAVVSVPAAELADALASVSYAVSRDELRAPICGVHFEPGAEKVQLVATDTHRLALREMCWDSFGAVGEKGVTIPSALVGEFQRLCAGAEGAAELTIGERRVALAVGARRLSGNLIDAPYPNWRRVVPSAEEKGARYFLCDKGALQRVLTASAPIVRRQQLPKVQLTGSPGSLTVWCRTAQGDFSEDVELIGSSEGAVITAFNLEFLLGALESLPDGALLLEQAHGQSVARMVVDDDDSRVAVLMPMTADEPVAPENAREEAAVA